MVLPPSRRPTGCSWSSSKCYGLNAPLKLHRQGGEMIVNPRNPSKNVSMPSATPAELNAISPAVVASATRPAVSATFECTTKQSVAKRKRRRLVLPAEPLGITQYFSAARSWWARLSCRVHPLPRRKNWLWDFGRTRHMATDEADFSSLSTLRVPVLINQVEGLVVVRKWGTVFLEVDGADGKIIFELREPFLSTRSMSFCSMSSPAKWSSRIGLLMALFSLPTTPLEMWIGKTPSIIMLRAIGSEAFCHLDKQ